VPVAEAQRFLEQVGALDAGLGGAP